MYKKDIANKSMITKSIYLYIVNSVLLDINKEEFKVLETLTISSTENKLISKSRNLKFVYNGEEEDYNSIKETIILYLFEKDIKIVYLSNSDARKDFKINNDFDLSFRDYLEGSKKVTRKDDIIMVDVSGKLHMSGDISFDIIKNNIKDNDFKELYVKVKKNSISRYIHLIELYNYASITINDKIKNINYFMIIEALANYYDLGLETKARCVTEKINNYFNSKIGLSKNIFSNKPNDCQRELYDIRSSIVHNGNLSSFREKNTKKFLQNKTLNGINSELDKYVKHVLKKEINEFIKNNK